MLCGDPGDVVAVDITRLSLRLGTCDARATGPVVRLRMPFRYLVLAFSLIRVVRSSQQPGRIPLL